MQMAFREGKKSPLGRVTEIARLSEIDGITVIINLLRRARRAVLIGICIFIGTSEVWAGEERTGDVSQWLESIAVATISGNTMQQAERAVPTDAPAPLPVRVSPIYSENDPAIQPLREPNSGDLPRGRAFVTDPPPVVLDSFEGLPDGGALVPDTNGAVGPGHATNAGYHGQPGPGLLGVHDALGVGVEVMPRFQVGREEQDELRARVVR